MKKAILVLVLVLMNTAFARMEPTVSADAAEKNYDNSASNDEHGWNTAKERNPASKSSEEKKLLDDASKKLDAIYNE